jgi:hypothetical protein
MECVLPDVKSTFTILNSAYGREVIFFFLILTLFNIFIVNWLAMYFVALCTCSKYLFYFVAFTGLWCIHVLYGLNESCLFFVMWHRLFFLFLLWGILVFCIVLLQSMAVVFSCLIRGMSCCLFSYATRHELSTFSLLLHGKVSGLFVVSYAA